MPTDIGHFIDGARSAGASGRTAPSYNPATGEQSGLVALASAAETGAAVAAAKRAFPSWAGTPPLRRARILNRFLRLCEERTDALAAVVTAEHGKVLADAAGRSDARYRGSRIRVRDSPLAQGRIHGKCRHEHGRFPRGAAASGSRCRHHPVQFSGDGADVDVPPCHRLRQYLRLETSASAILRPRCSLPNFRGGRAKEGLLNVVNGDKVAVDAILLDIPDIEAVSFVGSTPVAEYIYIPRQPRISGCKR